MANRLRQEPFSQSNIGQSILRRLGILETAFSAGFQQFNAGLSAISALATTAFGRGLLTSTDASDLRVKAGVGTIATQDAAAVLLTGGSITGIVDLAIADGGTGASTAPAARSNLGLGTAATNNIGTTGATVPLLSGMNTWSAQNLFADIVANMLTMTGAAGTNRIFYFNSALANRWAVLASGEAESGGNSGSNFGVARYTDAGGYIDQPLTINRATGTVNFGNNIGVAGDVNSNKRFIGALPSAFVDMSGVSIPNTPIINWDGGDFDSYDRANNVRGFYVANTIRFAVNSAGPVIPTSFTPASSTAAGTTGQQAWDANYYYVCVATNSWKRTPLSAW